MPVCALRRGAKFMASIAPVQRPDQADSAPVPFFDWARLFCERSPDYLRIIEETASSGSFILQAEVDEFEKKLAAYLNVRHAIGVSDCTNAMLLGLRASGIAPGDEIILPAHAFIAAAQAIHFACATPVPVDILDEDGLVDPASVRRAITPRTRGIMAVHVNGRVCKMDVLERIAAEHGLELYEDAAQALGSRFDERPAGSFGRWGAFSFYPSKTLGCFGDAGALVTNDDDLSQLVRAMRNHGAGPDKRMGEDCAVWGTNARIDNIQAAILSYKLDWYGEAIARRRAIAGTYHEALSGIAGLQLPPRPGGDERHFDIFQNYESRCDCRDLLRAHLGHKQIGTIMQWGGTPLHHFSSLGLAGHLPCADLFSQRSLLLPMNHLLGDDEVATIIDAVLDYFT